MGLFLFRFWPALVPFLLYVIWFLVVRHKAIMEGKPEPHFKDGPLYWMIITSLLIAAVCFMLLAMVQQGNKGEYIPPYMDNGKMMPSQIRPESK
jgi:hypothetical protein